MNAAHFFGYGSLVNLATHDYTAPRLAALSGWRRVWRHTTLRPVAYLSVEPCENTEIAGVIAQVPQGDWAALDEREAAYVRRDVTDQIAGWQEAGQVAVYQVEQAQAPTARHPILLSYVDVVLQGYLQQYGQEGAREFCASTHGWNAPILNDRNQPRYPRHQILSSEERTIVDGLLAEFARP